MKKRASKTKNKRRKLISPQRKHKPNTYVRKELTPEEIAAKYPNEQDSVNSSNFGFKSLSILLVGLIILVGALQYSGILGSSSPKVKELPEVFNNLIYMRTR